MTGPEGRSGKQSLGDHRQMADPVTGPEGRSGKQSLGDHRQMADQ
jgi:hypothetical protein